MTKVWVVLELSRSGELMDPDMLRKLLVDHFPVKGTEIFIPALTFRRKSSLMVVWIIEGYVFIEGGHPASYYFDLEDASFISKVLSTDSREGRNIQYLKNADVELFKHQLQEHQVLTFEVGDVVDIHEGIYKNLHGEIVALSDDKETAYIQISELESLNTIPGLPIQFISHKSDEADDENVG